MDVAGRTFVAQSVGVQSGILLHSEKRRLRVTFCKANFILHLVPFSHTAAWRHTVLSASGPL